MVRSCSTIFERVGHEIYCGEALYFGGRDWLGKRQNKVWVTASIRVQHFPYGPEPLAPQPPPYGPQFAALEVGIRAELLYFMWVDSLLALSETCVAFLHTTRASRQAYIDLRWEESLARTAQDMFTYHPEHGTLSVTPPWPALATAAAPLGHVSPPRRRRPDHSRSRSRRRPHTERTSTLPASRPQMSSSPLQQSRELPDVVTFHAAFV